MSKIEMAGPWVNDDDIEIVLDALKNGWYGKEAYKYCELFEKEFAKYHDRKFALMTPNCTSALHLLLEGLNIKDDDEVIAPECTWIGSTACITYQRAKPVFADIERENWCLSRETVSKVKTEKTKAVIAVDLFGNMPDYDELQTYCDENNIFLIEDAAEAVGSKYKGVRAGKHGIASVFSFHRTKTLTTGEGGMLLIDDEELFERCKFLRDHGRLPGAWFNTEVTFKYMPFNVQAALGYAQFLRIEELVDKKRWILNKFKENLLDNLDIQMNYEPDYIKNGAWSPAIVFGESLNFTRDQALIEFPKLNLPVRPFFFPLSSLPAYDHIDQGEKESPVAYDISSRGINVPCALNLTEEQIDEYCEGVIKILGN
jgi:perosamine synthetase